MMTFLLFWLVMTVVTALVVIFVCRGEDINYGEALTVATICLLWPFGLPCIIWAWLNEVLGDLEWSKRAFTMPGGKKK